MKLLFFKCADTIHFPLRFRNSSSEMETNKKAFEVLQFSNASASFIAHSVSAVSAFTAITSPVSVPKDSFILL